MDGLAVKRAYIVREVWQTERAYVESLKFTHEVSGLPSDVARVDRYPADTTP